MPRTPFPNMTPAPNPDPLLNPNPAQVMNPNPGLNPDPTLGTDPNFTQRRELGVEFDQNQRYRDVYSPTNIEATKGEILDPRNYFLVDPTLARAEAEKRWILPNYWAHDSEFRVLSALRDGPKHEREVCDRALAQVLEDHGSITMTPHYSGGVMLQITDKGLAKL